METNSLVAMASVQLLAGRTGRTLANSKRSLRYQAAPCSATSEISRQRDPLNLRTKERHRVLALCGGLSCGSGAFTDVVRDDGAYFSRGLLKPLQGTGWYDALESAMHEIGPLFRRKLVTLLNTFGGGNPREQLWFERLCFVLQPLFRYHLKGVIRRYTTENSHKVPGTRGNVSRKVDPYKLWYVNNGLYLVGFDHRSLEIRVFAVHRIDVASATNRRFEISESFNFDEFTGSAFQMVWGEPQHVAIRFRADQAPYVTERTWHSSQRITPEDDGSVILEMDVADLDEVKRWLMGFGGSSEVIEPLDLRRKVIEALAKALETYGTNEPIGS